MVVSISERQAASMYHVWYLEDNSTLSTHSSR
jgi:hypothetical protein